MNWKVLEGDCVEVIRSMPADSVDAVVTDPPYGLEFMGKEWDSFPLRDRSRKTGNGKPTAANGFANGVKSVTAGYAAQAWHEAWAREALRVLKPGGFLLAAGGTRTYHRLVCAIEDAGFEIRDTVMHVYGSGFPKSLNVGKAIDKMAGAEREAVGAYQYPDGSGARAVINCSDSSTLYDYKNPRQGGSVPITAPATEAAEQWDGWGTALKPAQEPWTLARKPLSESSVARQVLSTGTGAINVDASRVQSGTRPARVTENHGLNRGTYEGGAATQGGSKAVGETSQGRWPANLLLSHSPECRRTGEVRRVKASAPPGPNGGRGGFGERGIYSHAPKQEKHLAHYHDPDGTEPQEVWECQPDCPVRLMDEQSGTRPGQHKQRRSTRVEDRYFGAHKEADVDAAYGDKGGASRFFQRFAPDVDENGCVEGCPVRLMDEQGHKMGAHTARNKGAVNHKEANKVYAGEWNPQTNNPDYYKSDGGSNVSRFFKTFGGENGRSGRFLRGRPVSGPVPDVGLDEQSSLDAEPGFQYVAKASRRERNAGLEGMPEKPAEFGTGGNKRLNDPAAKEARGRTAVVTPPSANPHPTVKPIALMRYLVRLITPPGGTVLDCFAGSGSTGCAAVLEGFDFIGIEREPEYAEIARRRIAHWSLPEEARANGNAPAKQRTTYGFKTTDVERRCPEHGEPIPSDSTTYKCGCAKVWYKVAPSDKTEPAEPLTTLF